MTQGPTIAPRQGARARARRPADLAADRRRAAEPAARPVARREDREHRPSPARRPGWTRRTSSGRPSSSSTCPGSSRCSTRRCPTRSGPIRSVRPMDPLIAGAAARPARVLRRSAGHPRRSSHASGVQMISHDAGAAGHVPGQRPRRRRTTCTARPTTFWAQADADHRRRPREQFAFARSADAGRAPSSPGRRRRPWPSASPARRSPTWTWDARERHVAAVGGRTPATAAQRRAARPRSTSCRSRPTTRTPGSVPRTARRCPPTTLVGEGDGVRRDRRQDDRRCAGRRTAEDAPMQLFTADGQPARPRARATPGSSSSRPAAGR